MTSGGNTSHTRATCPGAGPMAGPRGTADCRAPLWVPHRPEAPGFQIVNAHQRGAEARPEVTRAGRSAVVEPTRGRTEAEASGSRASDVRKARRAAGLPFTGLQTRQWNVTGQPARPDSDSGCTSLSGQWNRAGRCASRSPCASPASCRASPFLVEHAAHPISSPPIGSQVPLEL